MQIVAFVSLLIHYAADHFCGGEEQEMSQLDLVGCRKRKRDERVFKFKHFGEKGYPVDFNGSFEQNLRALLEFGHKDCGGSCWSFQLEIFRQPLLHLLLVVVEEAVEVSVNPRCKHCQHVGWGNHMICNKKYHFLLLLKTGSDECCMSNVMELQEEDRSLHGMFHSNGFGHLLCINGLEAGSALPGYQIIEFWDRLSSGLGARKVSLKDASMKKGMDLRLLHSVAYGKPWFGRWGYAFGRGSFGVDQESYQTAVKAIQSIPLNLLGITSCPNEMIQIILSKFQLLSGHSLSTLGQLLYFMLELASRLPKEAKGDSNLSGIMSDASCRWSPKRVEMAIHAVVEALKQSESRWVSRQHVRDVARTYIGDTGLLDFVLKSLGNHSVGKYFVRRCLNPVTKVLEYCLEDVSGTFTKQEAFATVETNLMPHQLQISSAQLMKDIQYIYKSILEDSKTNNEFSATIPVASRIILDSKHLVKDYTEGEDRPGNDGNSERKIYCSVALANGEAATPYHCFTLRNSAVFDDLKHEAEKMFRETYLCLRRFAADSILNIAPEGSDLVFKTVKPGSKIVFEFEGNQQGGTMAGVCEQGLESVDCICGTKSDDGERMVSCDICQVQQHTRCVNIPDGHEAPNIYLCTACEQDILSFPGLLP